MGKSDTRRAIAEAIELNRTVYADLDLLYRRLAEFEGTISAARYDGQTSSAPGNASSPTERHAFRHDPAAQARRRLERLAQALYANAAEAHRLYLFWTTEPDRAGAGEPAPGCEILAQVGVWATRTKAGNLPEARMLSRWAADFVRRNGRLPTKAEAEAHAQGRKVRAA